MPFPPAKAHAILRRGVPPQVVARARCLEVGKGNLADLVGMDRATASRKVILTSRFLYTPQSVCWKLLEFQCSLRQKIPFEGLDVGCAEARDVGR